VYKDGNNVYAKDENGNVICQNSPTACLQESINYLYQRSGGRILIKAGTYYPTQTVVIPDGISIAIEGEVSKTVFKYTDKFILFYHDPWCVDRSLVASPIGCTRKTPSWKTEVAIRDMKIDRSGSGVNYGKPIHLLHGRKAVVENVEIIDDYRDTIATSTAHDIAIMIINMIVGIVNNCTIKNKLGGIENSSYLSISKNNYIENTAYFGIMGEGIIYVPWATIPPDYGPGGISIIESNVCIDCGRKDEAIAVDFHSDSLVSPVEAVGIIRNNLIVGKNSSIHVPIAIVDASDAIIQENKVQGNIAASLIYMGETISERLVINNNIIRATPTGSYIKHELSANLIVFENNVIEISSNNLTQNVSAQIDAKADHLMFRKNKIVITYPSGYYSGYALNVVPLGNADFVASILDNYIDAPVNPNLGSAIIVWSKYTIPHYIWFKRNYVKSLTNNRSVLGLAGHINSITYYAYVKDNIVLGSLENNVRIWNDTDGQITTAILDSDIPAFVWYRGAYKYAKRNSGKATFSGDGTTTQFKIPHNLISTPSRILVTPASENAARQFHVTADSTYIYVNYSTAPPSGTNNIVLYWYAEI
jgi:hypothetical protein